MSRAFRRRLVPLLLPVALLAACGDSGPGFTSGSIHLFVNPISSPFDPDGWAVSVDGAAALAIPDTGEILLEGLAVGDHEVRLTDVDEPCAKGTDPA